MPVVRNDPCGWTCLLMTYAAVTYADYVIIKWVVLQTMPDSAWGIGKSIFLGRFLVSDLRTPVPKIFARPKYISRILPWHNFVLFSVNAVAYNVIVLLLFISHTRAVFSDPGIVPLPSHPIDFSDAHQQTPKGTKNNKSTSSIPSGLLTNQTPPDEGNDGKHKQFSSIQQMTLSFKLSIKCTYIQFRSISLMGGGGVHRL